MQDPYYFRHRHDRNLALGFLFVISSFLIATLGVLRYLGG
jgi:hypothetical protein